MRPKTLNQTNIKLISERCLEYLFVAFHRGGIQSFMTCTPASPYNGGVQSACLHSGGVLCTYMMK